jgi:uncharacterized membrane protein YeaQ/YmgE (transglycosylase-associated protein family)
MYLSLKLKQEETEMSIITWIVLGILAGTIAKAIYPGPQGGGLLSTMVLGIIGAFLGGTLHSLLYTGSLPLVGTSLTISGVALAVLGSIIAITIWQYSQRSA